MADTIALSEIKSLALKLFDAVEAKGVTHVKVPSPQYWTVSPDAFEAEQPEALLGDVWDDLQDLRLELIPEDDERELSIWHAFHHLSGLMELIAHADNSGELLPPERSLK